MSLQDKLTQWQQRVNRLLREHVDQLDHSPKQLRDAMAYSLTVGGKRIRPVLVYLVGEMLDAASDDLDVLACSVECIHAYSLVHDDLPAMDDDDLRRGQPTCHIAFDEATAILAGDSLQTLAFNVLVNAPLSVDSDVRLQCLRVLTDAAGFDGMCGGQGLDLASTGKPIALEELQELHNRKTGALIKAAVLMPAYLTRQSNEVISALSEFADKIGLAFQVQDDVLDVISDTQTLGKPQGSDQQANKSTYPALLGLEEARQHAQSLYQESLHALNALPYNSQNLQEFAAFLINRQK